MVTPCRVDGLALAALLALVVRTKANVDTIRKGAWAVMALSLLFILALGFRGGGGFSHYGRAMMTAGYSAFAALFVSLIALAISAPVTSSARKLLELKPLMSVGRYSFAMYILHMTFLRPFTQPFKGVSSIQWLGNHLRSPNLGLFAFAILASTATYCLAWLSWHLYERHFLRLKKLFPY